MKKEEPSDSYQQAKASSVHGVKWTGAGEAATRSVSFMVTIGLARLLTPQDFGWIALTLIVVRFLQVLVDFGVSPALIQKVDTDDNHYHSVFTGLLALSILLAVALWLLADGIAGLLKTPPVGPLIRSLAWIVPLNALAVLPRVLLTRHLKFKQLALSEAAATLAYGSVAIGLAVWWRSVWCFVPAIIIEQLVLLGCLWFYSRWKPLFRLKLTEIKDVLPFGSAVFASRLLNFLNLNIISLFINYFFGSAVLGLYSLAFQIIDLPTQRVAKNFLKVLFPILSRLQQNLKDYTEIFLNYHFILMLIITPVFVSLFWLAEPFVLALYGEKWRAVIPVIRILSVVGFVRSTWTMVSAVSLSLGRPVFEMRLNAVQTILLGVFIPLGAMASFTMMLLVYTGILFVLLLFAESRILHWLSVSFHSFSRRLRKPILLNGFLCAFLAAIIEFHFTSAWSSVWIQLFTLSMFSALVYSLIFYLSDPQQFFQLIRLLFHPNQ